jgi:IS4 transposase
MYRNTRFSELMKGLPRAQFERVVAEHQGDKYAKGFRRWDQCLAMIFGQLSASRSLRELESAFNSQEVHHYHLGTRMIRRSTLADTNAQRDSAVYRTVCEQLLASTHRRLRREVAQMLYLLDSTPIRLTGRGYDDWAQAHRTHRTQGLKLHLLYSPSTAVPTTLSITAPNVNDVDEAQHLPIEAGATYVFDKGYCSYTWWHAIDTAEAVFVTRFKRNAALSEERTLVVPPAARDTILADTVVRLSNKHPGGGRRNPYEAPLRRIVVARPDKPTPLILATNDMTRSAEDIAALYRARWQIELVFKWLKQNLKIKRFLGRSENAVRTQLYIAIITYLLIALYRRRHGLTQSLALCTVVLAATLFQRPELDYAAARRRQRYRQDLARLQTVLPL